jgi:hypothetical protein
MGHTLVLKWARRHHSMTVDEFDSLDEALAEAQYASDYGQEALDHIEVWAGDGSVRIVAAEEAWDLLEPKAAQKQAKYEANAKEHPVIAQIAITTGKDQAWFGAYTNKVEAQREYNRLHAILGDRVIMRFAK